MGDFTGLGKASESFLLIFIGIQLIYNIVFVSGVQQSDSVIKLGIDMI